MPSRNECISPITGDIVEREASQDEVDRDAIREKWDDLSTKKVLIQFLKAVATANPGIEVPDKLQAFFDLVP